MQKFRYLLITLLKKPNNQIDEQVGYSRRIKAHDQQTCNVIMDFQDRKVLKCVIEGKRLDTDFDKLRNYYSKIYPVLIDQLEAEQTSQPSAPINQSLTIKPDNL